MQFSGAELPFKSDHAKSQFLEVSLGLGEAGGEVRSVGWRHRPRDSVRGS